MTTAPASRKTAATWLLDVGRLAMRVAVVLPLMLLAFAATARAQQIAFTWDDLPSHNDLPPDTTRLKIVQDIVRAMKDAGLPPAYGFINGVRLEQEPGTAGVLEAWRAAGYPLGNHGWTHMNLNQNSAAAFEHDLELNEPVLAKLMGDADWHWLRYPFLAEGDTPEKRQEVREYLAKKGYRIAGVSMSFGDYEWNAPYARCVRKGDHEAVAKLEQSYLQAAADEADYRRALSKAAFGHDIPYVLLMHVGALDARLLPQLLAMYKARGFRFVTLEQAERDPFYRSDLDPRLNEAQPNPYELAKQHGAELPKPPVHPNIQDLCK